MKLREKREKKALEAKERLEYWQGLSVEAQLKELEDRPGACKRQRARLEAKLANPPRKAPKRKAKA